MRRFPARLRCLFALLLICAGGVGILVSPSIGVVGSKELRSFKLSEPRHFGWGTAVVTSEFELPFVRNHRGLLFMNVCLAGSLGAIFGGVHWFAILQKKSRDEV